jgi:sulfite exporter TauE/SafE
MAGTASVFYGDALKSSLYMIAFGAGTLPMMLGITISGAAFVRFLQRFRFEPAAPIAVTLVALSLILRGFSLGIPYLSPAKENGDILCPVCTVKQQHASVP